MRVLVLGAGAIGVTTAYYLGRDGHEVTVLDRNSGPAEETSYANAGLIAPSHAYAWASPEALKTLLRSLYRGDQALRVKLSADPLMWRFFWLFLWQCSDRRARLNTERKLRLCRYAQEAFRALLAEEALAYDGLTGGLLYLYRSQESFERGIAKSRILADGGQRIEVVDRDRAAALDPALVPAKEKIAGALFAPDDESGDAHLFTRALAELCHQRYGARFVYDCNILALSREGERLTVVKTEKGDFTADHYVLALGCDSPLLARGLGLRLPLYPVKGYSVTLTPEEPAGMPCRGGVDEDNLFAYCPLGRRLRFTATAEFAGYDRRHRPRDFAALMTAARDLFPAACEGGSPRYWACLRPMTPQGTPFLGPSGLGNLSLNTGQGHMGWTMACGSARIVADLIAGRKAEISLEGLTLKSR